MNQVSDAMKALEESAQRTHEAIAALASARLVLDDARRPGTAPERTAEAAGTMRSIEATLASYIEAEIAAHHALLDQQISIFDNACLECGARHGHEHMANCQHEGMSR